MKFILTAALLVTSFSSFAGIVRKATVSESNKTLTVTVTYGGGCREHKFTLEKNPICLESYPVQCSANLVETVVDGPDICEAIITKQVKFNLKKNGMAGFAYWTILGDVDQTGRASAARVLVKDI